MNKVKRLLNFCAVTAMTALGFASISTIVEATISDTFDEVDGTLDIAITRCGETHRPGRAQCHQLRAQQVALSKRR